MAFRGEQLRPGRIIAAKFRDYCQTARAVAAGLRTASGKMEPEPAQAEPIGPPVIRLRTTLMRSGLLLPRLAERVLLHDGSGFAPRGIDRLVTEGSNCHTVVHGLHLKDVPLLLKLAFPFFCYRYLKLDLPACAR